MRINLLVTLANNRCFLVRFQARKVYVRNRFARGINAVSPDTNIWPVLDNTLMPSNVKVLTYQYLENIILAYVNV